MEPRIGITSENRNSVAHVLNGFLADEFVLYLKTRNAHWNVEGPDFYERHKFFEEQYEQLDEVIDDVAERIRSIGHYAPASLSAYSALTHLTEKSRSANTGAGFISELLADHESIISRMRQSINHFANDLNNAGSSDFITGLVEMHEKMAWMLRVQLK